MSTQLKVASEPLLAKGTPVPSRVTSPSQLRTARLPYSESLARDIESLSSLLNAVYALLANKPPVITGIDLANGQTGTSIPIAQLIKPFVGDSGAGGKSGLVPAPAAGDASANKYLKADGTWSASAQADLHFQGLHADRPSALGLANGTLYYETDRQVTYTVSEGDWLYASGAQLATTALRPQDLGPNDAGYLFVASDQSVLSVWNGTGWLQLTSGPGTGPSVWGPSPANFLWGPVTAGQPGFTWGQSISGSTIVWG